MIRHTDTTHTVRPVTLVVHTAAVFALITLLLIVTDFVPEPVTDTEGPTIVVATASAALVPSERTPVPESPVPVRIVIDDIDVDTPVTNPESTDVGVLDRALLTGAVRYPGSGALGTRANVLVFGHSSYLPIVHNKAYQAFNEIQKLDTGSPITVYSDSHRYTYKVVGVRLARAEETLISFEAQEPTLTLATCNTFGAEEERWVLTAVLVDTEPIL